MDEKRTPKIPLAWEPAAWEVADAKAMQMLAEGEASPEQQKRALNWIRYAACGTNDVEYRPDARDHAFCSGRRFVGLQINKLIGVNIGAFIK